jgi:hypothetical protein
VVPNNLVCGQMFVALRRMRVLYQDHRVAKRQRPTSGCVYTKLRMHSADYKIANSMPLKEFLQLRSMERIWGGLSNTQVGWLNVKAMGKLPRIRSMLKISRFGLVLHEDHNCACSTRFLGNLVDSSDDLA